MAYRLRFNDKKLFATQTYDIVDLVFITRLVQGLALGRLPQPSRIFLQQARDAGIARSRRVARHTSRGSLRDPALFPILALLPFAKRRTFAIDFLPATGDSHLILRAQGFHLFAQMIVFSELDLLKLFQPAALDVFVIVEHTLALHRVL